MIPGESRMPIVVAALQQKGGVGKTTLITSLFAHAVCGDYSAGIIDLDPQGNATAWGVGQRVFSAVPQHGGAEAFTLPRGEIARGVSRGITPIDAVEKAVLPCTKLGRGFVIPANPYMAVHTFEQIMLDAVPLDVVFVDTPPHLPGPVFRQIIQQAHAVVAPVQPETYALQNIPDLINQMADGGGQHLLDNDALRLVVNMRQKCANHDAWECVLREHWERWISPVVIARATAWGDMANSHKKWNPKSAPAKVAAQLWADVENSLQRRMAA